MTDRKQKKEQIEKFKTLKFIEKIEYLWMYYKIWLVVAVAAIVGIYLAVTMYRGMQENVLLNVVVVGGDNQRTKEPEKDFKAYAGINGKHDKVRIQANISADEGAMTTKTALTTLIGANAVDIMICPKETYEEYEEQGGFINIKEALGMADMSERTALVLEGNSYLKNVVGVPYETAYICVLINAQNEDMAIKFAKFLQTQ